MHMTVIAHPQASHTFDFFYVTVRSIIPFLSGTVLLIGGIWLLTLQLPGWKLILGIPAAQIGIVVLLLAFDDITKKKLNPKHYIEAECPVCRAPILIHEDVTEGRCARCGQLFNVLVPLHTPSQTPSKEEGEDSTK